MQELHRSSSQIEIIGNSIASKYWDGISVSDSNYLLIEANDLQKNGIGMIFGGNNSEIINNNFTDNRRSGLWLFGGENVRNKLSENNFINNLNQIRVSTYTNTISDNHWSDFVSPDSNNDGIVDIPYKINNSLTSGWLNLTDDKPHVNPFNIIIPTSTTLEVFIEKSSTKTSFDYLVINVILVMLSLGFVKKKKK